MTTEVLAYSPDPSDVDFEADARAYVERTVLRMGVIYQEARLTLKGPIDMTRVICTALDEALEQHRPIITRSGTISHPRMPELAESLPDRLQLIRLGDPAHLGAVVRLPRAKRLAKGRRAAVADGFYACGGKPPFGYRIHRTPQALLVPCPKEGPVVRQIFREYLRLGSLNALRARLKGQRIRTRSGGFWSHASLLSVLRNRVYVGEVTMGEIRARGRHEPLVEASLFREVQRARASRRNGSAAKGA